MDQITVYTKKRCPFCTSSKIWLKQRDYAFTEISLDVAEDLTKFITENPNLKSVPQIFLGDKLIGGFTELIESELAASSVK